jgi:hypothetical protein
MHGPKPPYLGDPDTGEWKYNGEWYPCREAADALYERDLELYHDYLDGQQEERSLGLSPTDDRHNAE